MNYANFQLMHQKRKFSDLRSLILHSFNNGPRTVNQLSDIAGINWKTVDNHLTYLVGRGFVRVVFSSPYAKIFELSELGKEKISSLKTEGRKKGGIA